jgi:hypothetical protein
MMNPPLARKKTDVFMIVQQKPLRWGVTDVTRWDEKAGLRRDAVGSQLSTCSKHKR